MQQTFLEVRPFLPIDLPLIRRLTPHGVSLDPLTSLTKGVHTVEGAVKAAVPLTDLGTPTFIIRQSDASYIAQYRHKMGASHAHIVFIAPDLEHSYDDLAWMHLLDAMVISAGRRGAFTLNAEVEELSVAFEVLQRAGFATYARQEIWLRKPASLPSADPGLLRPCKESDWIGVQSLYSGIVPRLVIQADEPPDTKHGGLVYVRNGKIAGYFNVHEGKNGIYIQPLLNPEGCANLAPHLLGALLNHLPRAERLPVYIGLRRYQSWLQGALADVHFSVCSNQAVMVKHTTSRIEQTAMKPVLVREGRLYLAPPVGGGDPWKRLDWPTHEWKFIDQLGIELTIEGNKLNGISDNR